MNIREKNGFVCEEDYPVVQTTEGKLRGYVDGDVFCFRGVDYAWAERFQMPEPPKSWEGIQDALDYGYGCPEMSYSLKRKKPERTVSGAAEILEYQRALPEPEYLDEVH